MKQKHKFFKITEEILPNENIKKTIYQSDTITIITDNFLDNKDEFGFLKNDLPDYAR